MGTIDGHQESSLANVARAPIHGPCAWRGAELGDDWILPLPEGAVGEIDAALAAVKARGLDWRDITRADFPLPGLVAMMAEVSRELEHGRGTAGSGYGRHRHRRRS